MSRAVAITGVGTVCSLGADAASFWAACLRGDSRVEPYTAFQRTRGIALATL